MFHIIRSFNEGQLCQNVIQNQLFYYLHNFPFFRPTCVVHVKRTLHIWKHQRSHRFVHVFKNDSVSQVVQVPSLQTSTNLMVSNGRIMSRVENYRKQMSQYAAAIVESYMMVNCSSSNRSFNVFVGFLVMLNAVPCLAWWRLFKQFSTNRPIRF